MPQYRSHRVGRSLGVGSLLIVAALWLVPATPAAADYPYGARGEVARLGRQLYDFHYRNSNNNVYRRSNQNHPTKNVYRSSRHYQKRLAASYSGYPLRTIYHDRRGGRRSVVHPRRQPYGPSYDYGYPGVIGCATPYDRPPQVQPIYIVQQAPAPPPPKRVTREDIEMVPIRVAKREPKQRAIIEKVTNADGSVRTVIRSVPIEKSGDAGAPESAVAESDAEGESEGS